MTGPLLRRLTPGLVAATLLAVPLTPSMDLASAYAADPLPARGLVSILPVEPLVADGKSPAVVHAVLLTPEGAPVEGARLRALSQGADISGVDEAGGGVYRIALVPSKVSAPGMIELTLKGRSDALGPVEVSRSIEVRPPAERRLSVSSNLPSLTLGQDAYATVSFTVPEGPGPAPTAEDLVVRASAGEVTSVTPMGSGRFTARYVPPKVNYPHLALLTVVDRRDPQAVYGGTSIRLMGKVDYPVSAPPGANVVLQVGGRDFGPVTVDGTGRAQVPIIVPPGVSEATQITANGGQVTEERLDLRVPATRRQALYPAPSSIPSDSRFRVPLRIAVFLPDGAPDPSAALSVTATAGKVSIPTHVGEGIYEVVYTPPDGRVEVEATLQVTLEDGSPGDDLELRLTPPLPSVMSLSTDPVSLSKDGTALDVLVELRAADGVGLAGRDVWLDVVGASPSGGWTDLGGGSYRRSFRAEEGTGVRVEALARSTVSENPVGAVVLLPSSRSVSPGGRLRLHVLSVDRFGQPVADQPVDLSVLSGGGSLPGSVRTGADGLAAVDVRAGGSPDLLSIRATAGAAVGIASVVQADLADAPQLPPSGSDRTRLLASAWADNHRSIDVAREGAEGPVVAPPAEPPPTASSGPVARLEVQAQPDGVVPGDVTRLLIEAFDSEGRPVEGAELDIFATAGAVPGPVEALGGGRYSATLTAPKKLADPVKVNVLAEDGQAVAVVRLTIVDPSQVSPWGEAAEAPPPGPTEEATPAPEPALSKGRPEVDRPWLRARASFLASGYGYEQAPGDDPGPLYPNRLGWGLGRGGAAVPLGVDTALRFVSPKLPYVGVQGGFRWSRYEVASPAFDNVVPDNLFLARVAAVGRYPFQIGRDEIGIGARVGFRWDDFILFRGSDEPGSTIEYGPLALPGLDVGLEISAEIWRFYLLASGTAGFAFGTTPYAANVDVNLGYQINRFVGVDIGFAYVNRSSDLEGGTSGVIRGTVRDRHVIGMAGIVVGY